LYFHGRKSDEYERKNDELLIAIEPYQNIKAPDAQEKLLIPLWKQSDALEQELDTLKTSPKESVLKARNTVLVKILAILRTLKE
jgi:hypothetical protein